MPTRNKAFANVQAPPINKKKKTVRFIQKHSTPVQNIPEKQEKQTRKGCWISVCVGLCITIAIILAGLLPALIVTLTQSSSTSDTTTSITNTGISSTVYANITTVTSVTAISSSSNNASSTSAVSSTSVVSSASTSTSATGFTVGGAVASGTTAWYGYEDVFVNCSVNLINITITITVQKTVNATYRGDANTFWSGVLNSTYVDTGSQIIYTWTINSGQTIQSSGSPYHVEAQFYLFGINQTTSADTYQVTATTVTGSTNTVSGNF